MYKKILIRFAELSLKGKNKMIFIKKLQRNMNRIHNLEPVVEYDKMFLDYSEENINELKNVFGISIFSPVAITDNNLDNIKSKILELIENNGKLETFKVNVKRRYKGFPHTSMELNNEFGSFILKNVKDAKVDIRNPKVTINVEINNFDTFIYVKKYRGLGGLPVGIGGSTLMLISGGIDSPVAAFELMKRGIKVDFLNFISPPQSDAHYIEKVKKIVSQLGKYQGKAKVYFCNYSTLLQLIGLTSKQEYKINLMRRSFYRIANKIAMKDGHLSIANGENIGQVASQTMESIFTIQSESTLPVFRPVLTANKIDTINRAKEIGTYDISITKANETCELFAPKKPVTKPKLFVAQKLEKELEDLEKWEDKTIQETEYVII
ncbi:MAG: tRNA 4-thiouridine(8) synthase ThiI [Mycoplasma sp.]|nr:tRNA 4-thiouridine(8) synthase ThiI [Mycoplasma sp.]